jgi:hypothetical protein
VLKNVQIPPLRSVVPSITPAVDEAVCKALQLGQAQRFQSAAEMRLALGVPRALSFVAAAAPMSKPSPSVPSPGRQPIQVAPAGSPAWPAQPAPTRSGVPSWVWVLVGAAVLGLLCALVSIGALTMLAPR